MKTAPTLLMSFLLLCVTACNKPKTEIIETFDDGAVFIEKQWLDRATDTYRELYYYNNGQLASEADYRNGHLILYKGYYENGTIKGYSAEHNGKPLFAGEFYENGQSMGLVPVKSDGTKHGVANYFYEDGSIRIRSVFENDQEMHITYYDETGAITKIVDMKAYIESQAASKSKENTP